MLDGMYELVADLRPPPDPIRLTADQVVAVREAVPAHAPTPWNTTCWLSSVPIVLVDRVEDSTPYMLALMNLTSGWGDDADG